MTSRATVLNVDDYEAARYAKTRLLHNAGFSVIEAASGCEALKCLAQREFELVLLDVRLPDIDGREVCRRIKINPATANVRVVHTSAAFISDEDIASGIASGADHYLAAPFEPAELLATVRAALT